MPRLLGLLAALLAGLVAAPASARWLQADTTSFRVFSDGSEGQLRAMATTLEEYDRLLRLLTNTSVAPSANRLDVYLLRGAGALKVVSPRVAEGTLGFYRATPGLIAAFAIRQEGWGITGQDVLLHEYAHHFMMQYYPTSYPSWYVEGFAEYMMTADFQPKSIEVGRYNAGRAVWLLNGTWLPVATLLDGKYEKLTLDQRSMFYAESWLAVHYIFRTGKTAALTNFLNARAAGQESRAAFAKAFGMDYDRFDTELRAYRHGELSYLRIPKDSGAPAPRVDIHPLPEGSDDLVLPSAALRMGLEPRDAPAMLARVRSEAADHPDSDFARTVLARAEIGHGDVLRGIGIVDNLLATRPDDVNLLYLRGMAALRQGRADTGHREALYETARKYFVRAFRHDPNDVPTLLAYAETHFDEPMSENTLNVLLKAQDLAPQVRVIALLAAAGLMQRNRFDEAIAMLTPILTDPHAGSEAGAARALIDAAHRKEAPKSLSFDEQKDGEDDK